MSVTVSVNAINRLSRIELTMPYHPNGMVYGYGEVLLLEPDEPSKGAEIFKGGPIMQPEGDRAAYGVLTGRMTHRILSTVMEDSVKVDGANIRFDTLLKAMDAFLEKWRVEDEKTPPPLPGHIPPPTPPPDADGSGVYEPSTHPA